MQKLLPRHKVIARLLLTQKSYEDVAAVMGMTPAAIQLIVKDPLFSSYFSSLEESADSAAVEIKERIKEMVPDALNIIEEGLVREDVDFAKKLSNAWDVLEAEGSVSKRGKTTQIGGGNVFLVSNVPRPEGGTPINVAVAKPAVRGARVAGNEGTPLVLEDGRGDSFTGVQGNEGRRNEKEMVEK